MLQRFLLVLWIVFFWLPHAAFAGFAENPEVKTFIEKMVKQHHFTKKELVALLNDVKPRPTVIRSVKAPLEQKPWYTYQMLFVTEWRIREGVAFWNKYQDVLEQAEEKYGVPASIIVATIGVETKYGKSVGEHRVLDALANLAFSSSPRAPFFRKELEEFLLLAREQHLNPRKVLGSYAGAIGQPQFMPSSYRRYAVNFAGGKKIDLTNNQADIICSVANYYQKHGWQTGEPVATRLNFQPQPFSFLTHTRNVPDTQASARQKTKYIELQGYFGREYWLSYPNFAAIKRYNPSNLYAMAVYQLSQSISTLKGKTDNA